MYEVAATKVSNTYVFCGSCIPRPKLTKDFYDKLDNVIGETRFQGVDVDEDRLAELETLRDYLEVLSMRNQLCHIPAADNLEQGFCL